MSPLLKIVPLILYTVSLVTSLPIISKPLENNPDHLVWEALLTIDTRNTDPDKTRKVPKSIFITPNLNESKIPCPTGHKLGPDGKCYKTLNIDPLDILKTQIASLFNRNRTTIEYDEYDYSDYGESTESMSGDTSGTIGRYDVPLSLGFADEHHQTASRFPTRVIKDDSRIVLGINYADEKYKQTVDIADNGAPKSYNIHTERSALGESSTAITALTPMSIHSSNSSTEATATDSTTVPTDDETTSTDTSSLRTSEYSSVTIDYVHEIITEHFDAATDSNSMASTKMSNTENYSSTSSMMQTENLSPTIEIESETVPNLDILDKIFINGTNHTEIETKSAYEASENENKSNSSINNGNLSSTEETSTVPSNITLNHRFAISTATTSTSIHEHNAAVEQTSLTPLSKATEKNDEIVISSSTPTQTTSFGSMSSSSVTSAHAENNTPSINHTREIYPAIRNSIVSGIDDVHEIEIIKKDEKFLSADDIDYDDDDIGNSHGGNDGRNFTARLADESLFQGNSMALNTKYETINTSDEIDNNVNKSESYNDKGEIKSSANMGIATQLDTDTIIGDGAATTEDIFDFTKKENEDHLNIKNDEVFNTTPMDVNVSGDRDETSIASEITATAYPQSSSIYTTLINSLHSTHPVTKRSDGENGTIVVQTGNSNDDLYRIGATTKNENDDDYDIESTVSQSPLNTKQNITNAADARSDQNIRLGKNCYLKNYLDHYYIMCT